MGANPWYARLSLSAGPAWQIPLLESLLLFRNDQACDFVIGRLRNDFLPDQVRLCLVRAAVDNLLGIDVTDIRQGGELLFGCAVQVNEFNHSEVVEDD